MKQNTTYNRFVVLDVEQAADARSSVCAVGVAVMENGSVVFNANWLVKPPNNEYGYWQSRVHGLGPEDTADAPPLSEVWSELRPQLENSLLVGHNIRHDLRALRAALALEGVTMETFFYVDTLPLAKQVLAVDGYEGKLGLEALAQQLGLEHTAHNAGSDALVNLQLFEHLLSRLPNHRLPDGWNVCQF